MNSNYSKHFHLFRLCFWLILLFPYTLIGQSYWIQDAGGTTIDEAYSISADAAGNTYTTGYFSGTAYFGAQSLTTIGVSAVFITKTDNNGNFLWAIQAGGAGSCRGLAIKADAAGNSYITGFYYGSATFGAKTITSTGSQDVFIAKYDNTGKFLWVATAGGPLADIGNAITVDNGGNVIVTGEFAGTAKFGAFTLTSTSSNINIFTTKLDGNGNFLWAQMGSGPHTDKGLGVGCDPAGNVYVTGQFTDTVTFNSAHATNLYNAIFLIKYNGNGQEQWFTFAGGGTLNIANGIAVDNNSNIYLTGNFTGTLSFFASPTVTLTNKYSNRIFVAKYNKNGNLLWDVSDGSSSSVSSNAISLDAADNPYIIGNFDCRFNSYADQYGQGTFNTVGYWDIFVAKYATTTGAWQFSRQIGGHEDDLGYGISVDPAGDIYTAGSFNQDIIFTSDPNFIGYDYFPATCNSAYCADNNYGSFEYLVTSGSSDIFIAKPIDLTRQPYDFYIRNGGGCARPVVGVCIDTTCPDTVQFCVSGTINAIPNTCSVAGPDYTYKWSNGGATQAITVSTTGWYSVIQTSADGCFQSHDSIYVIIHPGPPIPTITDNLGVNVNSQNPKPIIVCSKTVNLTGGGFGTNIYYWSSGPHNDSTNFYTVDSNGMYCFNVKDKLGCQNSVCVSVTIQDSLPIIKPGLTCIGCSHDSIAFCKGNSFTMFAYDSISNPGGINQTLCIPPGSTYIKNIWSIKPDDSVSFSPTTNCPSTNSFTPKDSGWYTIIDTIKRKNMCDSDIHVVTDSIFVRIYPMPTDSSLSIKGAAQICPGDSVLLIALGTNFVWSTGSTKDSIWAGLGNYSIQSSITNQYGCSAAAGASTGITLKTAPTVNVTASNTTICPGDSVLLTCSGIGAFQWQGATGTLGTDSNLYVTTAGAYYCVLTDTNYCAPVLSNTANILSYSTPFLATSSVVICPGDSAQLNVVASAGSTIQWQPPLSGNDSIKYISIPGTYTCDVSSCGINTICTITVSLSSPVASITASPPVIYCNGDSVVLRGNSGDSLYQWSPGNSSNQSVTVKNPGTYTLVTTNTNGCQASDTITVTELAAITPGFIIKNALCFGDSGTIQMGTTGGTPPYHYFWSTGSLTSSIHDTIGFYKVIIIDAQGCIDSASATLTEPAKLVAKASGTNARCYDSTGNITTLGTTGGTTPYYYLWNNGATSSAIATKAGTYSVTIKDTNGCTDTAHVTITQPTQIKDSIKVLTNEICNGDSIGSAEIFVSGGILPYTYMWNSIPAQTTTLAKGLTAGVYNVTVKDSNGCISVIKAAITQPAPIKTSTSAATICIGQKDTAFATSTGGTPPYTYIWSTGATTSSIIIKPIITTAYIVKSTLDSNKCKGPADTIVVKVNPPLYLINIGSDTICPGTTATLKAIGSGGDGIYTYTWQPGNMSGAVVNVSPTNDTTYTVVLTDGCNTPPDTAKVKVIISPIPLVNFKADSLNGCTPLCVTFTNKSIVTDGTIASLVWTFGNGDSSTVNPGKTCYDTAGVYTIGLKVTSSIGCSSSLTVPGMITAYSHPIAAFTYSPTPTSTEDLLIYFNNESTDAYGIQKNLWQFNEFPYDSITTTDNPSYRYHDTGKFCPDLKVTNIHGCVDSVTECMDIAPFFTIYIPNAFTPNGDKINGTFEPKGDFICDFSMSIYDRWGMLLYYTKDINHGWNGTVMGGPTVVQEDTYLYLIHVTSCIDQTKHTFLGKVTLIQ
jgi:gliding motility-associated-like protein